MQINGLSSFAASLFSSSPSNTSPASSTSTNPSQDSAKVYDNGNLNFAQYAQDIQSAQTTLTADGTAGSTTGLVSAHDAIRVDIHAIQNQIKLAQGQFNGDTPLWTTLKSLIATQHQISAAGYLPPGTQASAAAATNPSGVPAGSFNLAAITSGSLLDIPA